MVQCILCQSATTTGLGRIHDIEYHRCNKCHCTFKDQNHFPDATTEKSRYLLHKNDVDDFNYQKFVHPIVKGVFENCKKTETGLDFGAGTAPVISSMLLKKGYNVDQYDPFFHPDTSVLSKKYDFIVCCEVVEHFHLPWKEFELLYQVLKPKGMLFCMTELLPEPQYFNDWYYKNDPTHVIFYSEKTLNWIKSHYGFSKIKVDGRLFVLTK